MFERNQMTPLGVKDYHKSFWDKPLSLSRPDEDSFRFASDLSGILYFSVKSQKNQSGRRNVIRKIILFRNNEIR